MWTFVSRPASIKAECQCKTATYWWEEFPGLKWKEIVRLLRIESITHNATEESQTCSSGTPCRPEIRKHSRWKQFFSFFRLAQTAFVEIPSACNALEHIFSLKCQPTVLSVKHHGFVCLLFYVFGYALRLQGNVLCSPKPSFSKYVPIPGKFFWKSTDSRAEREFEEIRLSVFFNIHQFDVIRYSTQFYGSWNFHQTFINFGLLSVGLQRHRSTIKTRKCDSSILHATSSALLPEEGTQIKYASYWMESNAGLQLQ